MQTNTRVYESKKWRTKKFLGIPAPLLALILVAGVVAAAVVGASITSSSQTIASVNLAFGSGVAGTVDPAVTWGQLDDWSVIATSSASGTGIGQVYLSTVVNGPIKCTAADVGTLFFQEKIGASYVTIPARDHAGGLCTAGAFPGDQPVYYDTTLVQNVPSVGSITYLFEHTWSFPGPAGGISGMTFVVTPSK